MLAALDVVGPRVWITLAGVEQCSVERYAQCLAMTFTDPDRRATLRRALCADNNSHVTVRYTSGRQVHRTTIT